MAWINQEEIISGVAKLIMVEGAVRAAFGTSAKDYEVVHSVEEYAIGVRNRETGEVVGSKTYDPAQNLNLAEVLESVVALRTSLGIAA